MNLDYDVNATDGQGRPRDVIPTVAVNADGSTIGGLTIEALELRALTTGLAYLASVGGAELTAEQSLYLTLTNPPGSGRDLFVTNRLFSAFADAADRLEYVAYGNPTVVLTDPVVAVNRDVSEQASSPSIAVVRSQIATAGSIVMGGTQGSGTAIRRDGGVDPRKLTVEVSPGFSLGFVVRGAGQNLSQAARVFATLEWFEAAGLA